jgi:hypothetical protein
MSIRLCPLTSDLIRFSTFLNHGRPGCPLLRSDGSGRVRRNNSENLVGQEIEGFPTADLANEDAVGPILEARRQAMAEASGISRSGSSARRKNAGSRWGTRTAPRPSTTAREAAERHGVSRATAHRWLRKPGSRRSRS